MGNNVGVMEIKYAIQGHNINKKYKNFELKLNEFKIPEGFATALIGENGAGKSTLLNFLSGVRRDAKGEILYFNETNDVDKAKEKLGYTGTDNYFIPAWSGREVKEISKLLFDDFNETKFVIIFI